MNTDRIPSFLCGLLTITSALFCSFRSCNGATAGKMNFIIIIADDMGYNDIGYTNPEVKTPTLDGLAKEGVILKQGYSGIACSPSRAALMTSYYAHRLAYQHNVVLDLNPICIPTNVELLSDRMKKLGYTTSLLGKWHLGFCQEECLPNNRGFDHFYGFWTGSTKYYDHQAGSPPIMGHDWKNGTIADHTTDGEFSGDIITRYAERLLDEHAEDSDPFFMTLSYFNPHLPLEVDQKYQDMYANNRWGENRAKYLGLISNLDDQVAKVVEKLKQTNLYENTMIIFTSDNGGAEGGFADNSPFRGGKCSLFEGGSRVPMFFHGPMLQKNSTEHEGLFHLLDIGETMVSLAGGELSGDTDGLDQTDMILNGGPSKRENVMYQLDMEPSTACGQSAVRIGDMKLIWGPHGYSDGYGNDTKEYWRDPFYLAMINTTQTLKPGEGYVDGYIVRFTQVDLVALGKFAQLWMWDPSDINSGIAYLFNIADDPAERNNLANDAEYSDVIAKMKKHILAEWESSYNGPTERMLSIDFSAGPANSGGEFATGWCPDDSFTLDIKRRPQDSSDAITHSVNYCMIILLGTFLSHIIFD